MLELTAGKVATMYDSQLGFRHGPKSIINDTTLTVAYLSDDDYRRRYELDLIKEMAGQRKGNKIAVVYNKACAEAEELADYTVQFHVGEDMENIMLGLNFIMFAQTLAVMKSLSMGITPDNPCPTGEVNRVVKGVILYPYTLN
jgi:tagatose-6-phosphate ketose/aldose isomerase